jgi:patatin-like phospholipase/acyl hydrolase
VAGEITDMSIPTAQPRSLGSLEKRREQLPWPKDREFRILSIDGGGIKGIFPACFLAEIEERYLSGGSIAEHFDLITGTSTGGIIALCLSIGMPARDIANLYIDHGQAIFPSPRWGMAGRGLRFVRGLAEHQYDRAALMSLLQGAFGERLFGEASSRLCIPSCDGRHGDVYVFKTPHHPDFKKDQYERMTTVAAATAAAPTFFQPLDSNGYRFLDGGLWANNPVMVGLVDTLSCFNVDPHQVRVLSLGCGDEPFRVSDRMMRWGGLWSWRLAINAAMSFQSKNVLGQAGLLIGAERLLRIVPNGIETPMKLDDCRRASNELPVAAATAAETYGATLRSCFLGA